MVRIRRSLVFFLLIGLWPACGVIPARAEEAGKPDLLMQMKTLDDLSGLVRRYYYQDTNPVNLYDGAIEGYLSRLDPHSTYISPGELQETQERLQGSFEGIGIYFDIIDNFLTVLAPIEGSPAYEAGLMAGDRIVKIDGVSAVGLKVSEVTRRLKGPKGSRVRVTVQREGLDNPLEIEIVRDKIEVPSVPVAFKLRPDVGYVKINRFSSHTSEELRKAIGGLLQGGIKKLILDLRGNGGGYLEQAVLVANMFIERGQLLVYTEGRRPDSREDYYAERDPLLPSDIPLLVLVNSYSASASEIVAGALQDYDRGMIVGHTTFGKGLVQKQYRLPNGGAVLLTVARYFTPSDRPIQRPFSQDREEYVEEAHDDYDPNADPDSTADKPVYYTRVLRRKVYGSGGITPDVVLEKEQDSVRTFQRRLGQKLGRSNFFEFATQHAAEYTQEYTDPDAYRQNYEPGHRELTAFRSFLKGRGIEVSDRDFKAGGDLIRREIKRDVAQIRWGSRVAGEVAVSQDPEVLKALPLFGRAEAMLASRNSSYNREQGRMQAPGAASGQVR